MINDFFNWCVLVLEIMADYTGIDAADPLPQPNRANAEAAPQQHRSGE